MDPPAKILGSALPLAASASESSVASQLLQMEGKDHEMLCSATVSEPAGQQDSPKEQAEEDLVSHILADNDSEMVDADCQTKPVAHEEEPNSAGNSGATPPRLNLDDTAERLSENEDDDDEDMSSELSAGDDLQVSF